MGTSTIITTTTITIAGGIITIITTIIIAGIIIAIITITTTTITTTRTQIERRTAQLRKRVWAGDYRQIGKRADDPLSALACPSAAEVFSRRREYAGKWRRIRYSTPKSIGCSQTG
jgi:hypothetical protein